MSFYAAQDELKQLEQWVALRKKRKQPLSENEKSLYLSKKAEIRQRMKGMKAEKRRLDGVKKLKPKGKDSGGCSIL